MEYLQGPAMEIRIHDRDKIPLTESLCPVLFGNDDEDEKIGNVGYISGKYVSHDYSHMPVLRSGYFHLDAPQNSPWYVSFHRDGYSVGKFLLFCCC